MGIYMFSNIYYLLLLYLRPISLLSVSGKAFAGDGAFSNKFLVVSGGETTDWIRKKLQVAKMRRTKASLVGVRNTNT